MKQPRTVFAAILTLLLAVTVAASFAQQNGYYVLDGFGGVHSGGGAPAVFPQTPYFGFDAAVDIVYIPPGASGNDGVLVLDALGGVHAGGAIAGGSLAPATPYFGFDIARGIAARSSGVSGWERRSDSCRTIGGGVATGSVVSCTGSKKVTGGGVVYFTSNTCATPHSAFATSSRFVTHSGPSADNAWSAGVFNDQVSSIFLRFYAICVDAN